MRVSECIKRQKSGTLINYRCGSVVCGSTDTVIGRLGERERGMDGIGEGGEHPHPSTSSIYIT